MKTKWKLEMLFLKLTEMNVKVLKLLKLKSKLNKN